MKSRQTLCVFAFLVAVTALLSFALFCVYPLPAYAAVSSGQTKTGGTTSNNKNTKSGTEKKSSGQSSSDAKNPIISRTKGSGNGPAYEKKASSSNAVSSYGWQKDDIGWWYRIDEKEYIRDGWAAINGKLYCFNDIGYMVTGWVHTNDSWYFLEEEGHMVTGDYKIGKTLYHFDKTGKLDLAHYDYGDFPFDTEGSSKKNAKK